MKPFELVRPASVDEALAAWVPGAAWLGGGTNLVDLMKTGAMQPDRVIDLSLVPGLSSVDVLGDGAVRVGALVRNADLADDPGFAARFPMVAEALLSGASGQLRNAATVAGNLMQKTRCAYFQDGISACNRREPGAGCDAVGGVGENYALVGGSAGCIATNPSDFAVPLVALGAVVEIAGPAGAREVALADFLLLPGETPERETVLALGELIVAVRLPAGVEAFAAHSRYLKVRDRTSFAFAMTSAAAGLRFEEGRIVEARLALGGIAPKPWRVEGAEASLAGQVPGTEVFAKAAAVALEGGEGWKAELARRTAVRALEMAVAGTPKVMPALPGSVFADMTGEFAHV